MLKVHMTRTFKKDLEKAKKQKKPLEKLFKAIEILTIPESLPVSYRDHPLIGKWKGHRECHVLPDWLLVYFVEDEILYLERLGSHSELFS